ncbi:MAG TPA: SDR family NAD(P)-dependent oxidoreductase [Actinomycetota bacterium]|nr:SDR family NAD(P)-dependent oxidoreductase [Actinomycetota bacterium]
MSKTAVITGASAGIGAATALRLAKEGFDVVLGARRVDRLDEVARACGGVARPLDVADAESVREFCDAVGGVDVLVNNAGLAVGLTPIAELSDEAAERMWAVNVLGVLRMTRALLPKIEASGAGHVVNVGSIAGFETYRGGGGYTASKHALRALTHTLRLELLGKPIRVTEIAPGLVETEFSLVRFGGDESKAKQPYEGIQPLTGDDIADCIAWAVTRPPHVDVDEIVVGPVAQARATEVARRKT